ncbi:MAG: guanylate kinase [Myxococcota bacterium]
MRRGIPIVISAASGTGKTSLCRRLLETVSHVTRSISFTTRPPRGDEKDGRDYFFVDDEVFAGMVLRNEFIEWAEVFSNRYGTGFEAVLAQLDQGLDVLLDIDVQGGMQIRDRLPEALLVFLLPPSMGELRRRLVNRGTDDPEIIEARLAKARTEIERAQNYEFLVVNDDFEQAAADLRAIVRTRRISMNRPDSLLAALVGEPSQKKI